MIESLLKIFGNFFKRPFKIGIVSYHYLLDKPSYNGVALHTYNLSRNLAKIGCEVHVFCSWDRKSVMKERMGSGELIIHTIANNRKIPTLDLQLKKKLAYTSFDGQVISEIIQENNRRKFDIMHTHGWLTSGSFMAQNFGGIKWVHTFHALEKNRIKKLSKEEKKFVNYIEWIESTIIYANGLIAVSKKLREEILKNYKVEKDKIICIPNGVDTSIFTKSQKSGRKILFVGRFSFEKGIDIVLEIMKNVLKTNKKAEFLIIAPKTVDGSKSLKEFEEKFSDLIRKYPKNIILETRARSLTILKQAYDECLIYIQPSRYESFGMCALEAMACGKPIIASKIGGLPEVIGNAGILVKPQVKLFSDKILFLLKNRDKREYYGNLAFERAKNFDWLDIAKKTLNFYKKVSVKDLEKS